MKSLIIAEKPSVATDLARVLKVKKNGDFFENDQYVISSAVGHLVELLMPGEMDEKYKKWSLDYLPILPKEFKLKPVERTKKQLNLLKKLLKRADVSEAINACDAGREGELIFHYIYQICKSELPVKRLWMTSMTPTAIKDAFSKLRDNEEMQPLQDAARCRSEADWIVGINGTIGVTKQFGFRGGKAATVGRVQTPTLTMVVDRENIIKNFESQDYWRIDANFSVAAGEYAGAYQKPDFKKDPQNDHDRVVRIWSKEDAEKILAEVQKAGKGTVTEEKKRARQSSPLLYDLTTLQREANGRFGFSAGNTLKIAQSLYERHKVLTYPRTDSRALPEDYIGNCKNVLKNLGGEFGKHGDTILKNNWVVPNKRIFNNAKISDHFAIIPTDNPPKNLSEAEAKIYQLVTRRFLAVFFPPAEYDVTTRITEVATHQFKTEGKVLAVPGWLEVYGNAARNDELVALSAADGDPAQAQVAAAELIGEQTKPPPRYNEATLLAAMEGAGKVVEDEELAEAMKEKGLGTPATRASTIDHLVAVKYLQREGRDLVPTPKATNLIDFLKSFQIEGLTQPEMTGEWEYKLRLIEEGKLSRDDFMAGINKEAKNIINRVSNPPAPERSPFVSFTDNKPLLEDYKRFYSQDTVEVRGRKIEALVINKQIGGRVMSEDEIKTLLDKKEMGPLHGFHSRFGKDFSAIVKLEKKDNGSYRVELDFGEDSRDDDINLSEFPVIGDIEGVPVHAAPNAFISEDYDPKKKTGFRLSRNMLGREIEDAQVVKLLRDKKTDVIKGFRSNRTKRLFDAHLILKEKGQIGFEFPPRPAKKKVAKKATK